MAPNFIDVFLEKLAPIIESCLNPVTKDSNVRASLANFVMQETLRRKEISDAFTRNGSDAVSRTGADTKNIRRAAGDRRTPDDGFSRGPRRC